MKKSNNGCWDYCAGRIRGITENLKIRGKISPDFALEVTPRKRWRPHLHRPGGYILTCEHGREFKIRRVGS